MGLHDYRYNPFSDALEPVTINDEVHIVPTNAPYQIRLNEVPNKENPSTVSVRYYDNSIELVEVGAPPAQGQYWCDYNTANESWNTGLIRFSPADAGAVVKVSYRGIGTLASVKSARYPSWHYERGNGSLGHKICSDGEVFSGVYNFASFTVPAGATIYVNLTAQILCLGSFVNDGVVSGDGRAVTSTGYWGGKGAQGAYGSYFPAYNPGYPAAQALWHWQSEYAGTPDSGMIDRLINNGLPAFVCGSMGGTGANNFQDRPGGVGGMGGSGIIIAAKTIINNGAITSRGAQGGWNSGYAPGSGQGGGGGGGVILLIADKIKAGQLNVSGGNNGAAAGWHRIIELGV